MANLTDADIRASVAAGVIDEAQASKIISFAQSRLGYRANMGDDDEPFELFKGFSEIFVTVGLALLTSGFVALFFALQNMVFVPLATLIISALFARYFTLRRRMALPSIFLSTCFGLSLVVLIALVLKPMGMAAETKSLFTYLIAALGLLGYFRIFHVPFTMFLIGLCAFAIAVSVTGMVMSEDLINLGLNGSIASQLFDIGAHPSMAVTMLVVGVGAFAGGMVFDLRDPHRISRHSASAFWLHILAAPAIVNVIAVSLLAVDGPVGYLLAAAALVIVTMLALIIDRRSFLTAGIIYIGVILVWAIGATNIGQGWEVVWTLLLMGAFITGLGAWWVPLRTGLMRLLPDFPLKNQLPPYSEPQ